MTSRAHHEYRVQFNISMNQDGSWKVLDMDTDKIVDGPFLARHSAIARMKQLNNAGRW